MLTLGLRADQLVVRLPVGFLHRRQNGMSRHLAAPPGPLGKIAYYYLALALLRRRHRAAVARPVRALRLHACAPAAIRRAAPTPSASTCAAIQWLAFTLAGAFAGTGGRALRLLQGQRLALGHLDIPHSFDALFMVLLGGVQTLAGPVVGRRASTGCATSSTRRDLFWRGRRSARHDPAHRRCSSRRASWASCKALGAALARAAQRRRGMT